MNKSFKAALLESLLENREFVDPLTLVSLANQALAIFRRRRNLIFDIREDLRDLEHIEVNKWQKCWGNNPVNAWVDGNIKNKSKVWFKIKNETFRPTFNIPTKLLHTFQAMVQELIDFLYVRHLFSKNTPCTDEKTPYPEDKFDDRQKIMGSNNLTVGHKYMRKDIPTYFGEVFNKGNWNSGHVILKGTKSHILFVTLNKRGKSIEYRYHDYFSDDEEIFHWQSQNNVTPESKKGHEIINHMEMGIVMHLFVRENKLANQKAAPFKYYGPVNYQSHSGSAPMDVQWSITCS